MNQPTAGKCRYYGYAALERNRELVASHGNQCALIYNAHSPCRMEIEGDEPDLENCELHNTAREIDCRSFTILGQAPPQ